MDDHGNAVHRNRWTIAAVAGLVAFLMFWLSIGWTFLGGLLAGLIVFGILLLVIGLIGADAPEEGARAGGSTMASPAAASGPAGVTGPATMPARTMVSDAPVPAPAPADPARNEAVDPAAPANETSDPVTLTHKPADPVTPAHEPDDPVAATANEPPPADDAASPTEVSISPAGGSGSKPETLSAPRDGRPDDLRRIRGIGPKLETLCNRLGFWHLDQIAGWSEAEVDWVDAHLEGFRGRVRRDGWVAQAQALLSSDAAGAPDGVPSDGPR